METKIKFKVLIILIMLTLSIFSCKQNYFVIPTENKSCNQLCCTDQFDSEEYEKFVFKLKPIDIYKNNIQKTLLLSENSSFLSSSALFYTKTDQNILESKSTNYFLENWYNLELYISKQKTQKRDTHVLHKDDKIYIRSIVGKTDSCTKIKTAKMIHTFSGKIGKIVINDSCFYVALIDHITIINSKKDAKKNKLKNKLKDEFGLALVLEERIFENNIDTIKVHAIIDINYHNDKERPKIYDIKDIYGESIALIKDNN